MKIVLAAICFLSFMLPSFAADDAKEKIEQEEALAELLQKITEICGDRWAIKLTPEGKVIIESKMEVLGTGVGYGFRVGAVSTNLFFRFKVVKGVKEVERGRFIKLLGKMREQALKIEHVPTKIGYIYYPKNKEEWRMVIGVRRLEQLVKDLPEYSYKGVYLSEEFQMSSFVPSMMNEEAKALMKDVEKIYKLLTKLPR